jgi:FkbM family methyltransferase
VLAAVKPTAVLDVGANVGQFAEIARAAGFKDLIVSFEAVPQIHDALRRRASRDPRWIVAPCAALGSSRGTVQINVAGNAQSSSLLPMNALHREAAPGSDYVGRESVRMERLDAFAAEYLPKQGPLFLKIDTQGYEKEVLRGATGIMDRVFGIQSELSLVPLYEGAPLLAEMIGYFSELGFALFNLVPNFRDPRTGRVLQMDGFFVRLQ